MEFAQPRFSRADVNRAGRILCSHDFDIADWLWAYEVLANWRACHGYPINTFQALLRHRMRKIHGDTIVAQRLKRAPSVIAKLHRFSTMNLVQMQDIGGLRAIVPNVHKVRMVEGQYRDARFDHKLVTTKDYISNPKSDGYRSVHLVYRYRNRRKSVYNGQLIELQFRSKLQHAWATAVETMGTFLGQALKSGQGEREWREFFELASAAMTYLEETASIPGYEGIDERTIIEELADADARLRVLDQLQGFSIAARNITETKGQGGYHLVVLDSDRRVVNIHPYPKSQLERANIDYAQVEERAQRGERLEAVLVSAGPISALKKAYPNYFLDTHEFVRHISKVIRRGKSTS